MVGPAVGRQLLRGRGRRDRQFAFHRVGGPLVAVCGLVGGAGTTTIALSIARRAARASSVPVLLAESSPERAGLATLAGGASPTCLRSLAAARATDSSPDHAFALLDDGLRLIASAPRPRPVVAEDDLHQLLLDARSEHGLVVIDCGVIASDDAAVFQAATHVIWTLPRSATASRRGAPLLSSDVAPAPGRAHEVMAVSTIDPAHRPRLQHLRVLAAARCERLLLLPFNAELADGRALDLDHDPDVDAFAGLDQHLREGV